MTTGRDNAEDVVDVSVAMCTRNGEEYVAQQVRSILNQSPRPRELVVGDDASTDGTIAVIRQTVARHQAEHPGSPVELRVLEREAALGVTRNFESAILACTSPIVALSDQDDVWPMGRLARLLPLFADPAVRLVHTDARLVDERGLPSGRLLLSTLQASERELASLERGDAMPVLLRRNLVTGATVILRRELAERAAPFPDSWVHDEWLAMIAALDGGIRLVREPLLDYRQHAHNVIGASEITWARRWQRLREPREERGSRLVRRASALLARVEAVPTDDSIVELVRAKLDHEQRRLLLPRSRPLRIPAVLMGIVTGRYRRFSRGLIDVTRDLVQPVTRDGA